MVFVSACSVIARSALCVPVVSALTAFLLLAAPAQAQPQKLIALGDSLTQGYGLAEGDGFVPQLEAWLRQKGYDVQLVNAGVSGDTSQGGLSRLEWTLSEGADAMIVTLGGNDLLRGLDPALTRRNLDAILSGAAAKDVPVLLVAMEAPGNYGPQYREEFDRLYPELAEKHGVLLGESFLKPLVRGETNLSVMRDFMQGDGIHPNREGVTKIVEAMGPKVAELLDQARMRRETK
ncbi:arylesterase [Falsigemmobacter intermedius]|uniref:arylesterase n=1 Tax=Falsigemmobacter intermedius TaxID=1553448 RepID=UPI00157FA14F|nr:arylesterase [Falsigemmobacter intermedius]